jgi:transmembrane sensor
VTVEGKSVVLTRQAPQVQERYLAWRRGLLVFDRTALADAAEEFNRYNREKIVIDDPAIARTPIGGTFRADNISSFVSVAQDVLGLHAATKGGVTVISR